MINDDRFIIRVLSSPHSIRSAVKYLEVTTWYLAVNHSVVGSQKGVSDMRVDNRFYISIES